MTKQAVRRKTSVDPKEIEHFEKLAHSWWDDTGPFAALHELNPIRLAFIRDSVIRHYGRAQNQPLKDFKILDIGCGGGLLCEPLTRLGAQVTGVDASPTNIQVAQLHAQHMDLSIQYCHDSAENLTGTYDVVLAMEIVEHVVNLPDFIAHCCRLTKPGGLLFLSTLNRTMKSYLLGIIAAEYILGWVPKGTHQWEKFVQPNELKSLLAPHNLEILDKKGIRYHPLQRAWQISNDLSVNYMLCAGKNVKRP